MRIWWGLAACAVLTLSACDLIRVPGDNRQPRAPIPVGAPGPVPPIVPVDDPYNDGDLAVPVVPPVTPVETEPTQQDDPLPIDTDLDRGDTEPAPDPVSDPDPATDPVPDLGSDTLPTDLVPPETETETETETDTEPEPEPLPIKFQYYAPGSLTPGSGIGNFDDTVYAPGIVFPIKDAPTYPQSQVWRPGGFMGGDGDQCDPANYSAPWQDNFCETRSRTRTTPYCASNKVHQGQDIRVGTPQGCRQMVAMRPEKPTLYEVVAVEDGIIQYMGGYYIQMKGTSSGNIYNYIHLNMAALNVSLGDTVTAGQSLGYLSNDFGGTPTTFHLHFEIKAPLDGQGITHVPPYMSLVEAYERRENGRGERIEADVLAIASVAEIPEGIEIIE